MTPLSLYTRVLVIDDEPTIRELISDALREAGYETQSAANGAEGLEVLHRWVPNAIVLDLMMPRLDGMGFTQLLRMNPKLAHVPVVLVTAAYGAQEAASRVGAQAVVTKPFELDALIETVNSVAGSPVSVIERRTRSQSDPAKAKNSGIAHR